MQQEFFYYWRECSAAEKSLLNGNRDLQLFFFDGEEWVVIQSGSRIEAIGIIPLVISTIAWVQKAIGYYCLDTSKWFEDDITTRSDLSYYPDWDSLVVGLVGKQESDRSRLERCWQAVCP